MTTTAKRSTMLRSLPVLLALFLAFFAAPAAVSQPAAPSRSGSSSPAVAHHEVASAEVYGSTGRTAAVPVAAQTTTEPAEGAPRVLFTQLTARVSASRAPPAAA